MSYATELSRLLTHQLEKFATLRRHQLVGQVATIDFWLAEARHCLAVLDGYAARHQRVHDAQVKFVFEHQVVEFDARDPAKINEAVKPPRRASDVDLDNARRSLCVAVYRFLVRCHNKGFIDEAALRRECQSLGIEIDKADLKRP